MPSAGSLTLSPHDAVASGAWGKPGGGPANPQDLNRYSYGLNNPVRNTDPTGHINADGRDNERAAGGFMGGGIGGGGRALAAAAMKNPNIRSALVTAVGNGLYSAATNHDVYREQGLAKYAQTVGGSFLEGGVGGLVTGGFTNPAKSFLLGTAAAVGAHIALNGGGLDETATSFQDNALSSAVTVPLSPGLSPSGQIGITIAGNAFAGGVSALVQEYLRLADEMDRPIRPGIDPPAQPVPTLMPTRIPN